METEIKALSPKKETSTTTATASKAAATAGAATGATAATTTATATAACAGTRTRRQPCQARRSVWCQAFLLGAGGVRPSRQDLAAQLEGVMARKAAAVVPSSSIADPFGNSTSSKPAGVSDPFASSKPMGMGFKGSAAKPMMAVKDEGPLATQQQARAATAATTSAASSSAASGGGF